MQSRQYPQQGGDVVDLRDYVAVLRRRSLVITVLALLGLGLALGYSKLQTPIYTATAKILINPPPGDTSQNLNNVISVDTEAQVVKSAPIATGAAAEMQTDTIPTQLLKHVSVSRPRTRSSWRSPIGIQVRPRPRWGPTLSRRRTLNTSRQQGADERSSNNSPPSRTR